MKSEDHGNEDVLEKITTGLRPGDVSKLFDYHDHPDATDGSTHLSTDGDSTICGEPRTGLRPFPLVGDDENELDAFIDCDIYVAIREDICDDCRAVYFGSEDRDGKSWRQLYAEFLAEREDE